MKKELQLPGIAVVGGVVGLFLRRWALSAAFEADTGLAIPGHPALLILIVYTAAMALGLFLLCRTMGGSRCVADYRQAFYAPKSGNQIAFQSAAILLGLSSFITLPQVYPLYLSRISQLEMGVYQGSPQLQALLFAGPKLLQALLGMVGAVCLYLTARALSGAASKLTFRASTLIPAFYVCFWLINVYRSQATDPVVLSYAWHLFAILSVMLAMYYACGYSYENRHPRATLFTSLLSITFCLITLADPHTLAELLSLAAFLLWLVSASMALISNLTGTAPPAPLVHTPRPTPFKEDDDDVDIVL